MGHPLVFSGRPLGSEYPQIVDILRSRLGRNHAQLLAMPVAGEGGAITWTTPVEGPVVPAKELADDEQTALRQRADRWLGEIRGLAAQLRSEGPASQMVADILEAATRLPSGDWLYRVGDRPVVVMWGHADTPIALASTAPINAPVNAPALPSSAAVEPAVAASPHERRAVARWRWWIALPVLMLALMLALWGIARFNDAPADRTEQAELLARAERNNRALEEQIRAKRAERPIFECLADAPAPPPAPEPAASTPQLAEAPPEPVPKPAAPASSPEPTPVPKPVREARPRKTPPPAPPPTPATPPAAPPVAEIPPPPAPPPAPAVAAAACKTRTAGDSPEVIMIIDASGSMREPFGGSPSRLHAAKSAAGAMIHSLPPDVDVGLVDFAACNKVQRDKFYSAPERGALIGEIGRLVPQEGTPLAQAIQRAGAVASRSAESVMVIVSDGDDSCGGDPCAAARAVKASRPDLTINVVDLSSSAKDRQVLQCVASAGGGAVLRPGDTLDLNRKLKEAAGAANCPP